MNISLDYDDTYTKDPQTWDKVIVLFREAGHNVYVVTLRSPSPWEAGDVMSDLDGKVDNIFFTSRKAKKDYMYEMNIWIDVWIDDSPFFILNNAK